MDRIGRMDQPRLDDQLTELVIGCCFDVQNELGHGFLESVYVAALSLALRQQGLPVTREVPFQVMFRGECVGLFKADLVVDGRLLIEAKAVQSIASEHLAQAINYLKVSGIPIGLVVNFGRPKVEVRRVHSPQSHPANLVHPVPFRENL